MTCLRPLLPVCVGVALLCGCQRQYDVFGSVVDASSGAAVPEAGVFIADRIIDAEFDAFVQAPSDADPKTGKVGVTTRAGEFRAPVPITGPAGHSVWIVVMKPGFFEHHEEVWTGVGYPERRSAPMIVKLKPVPATR